MTLLCPKCGFELPAFYYGSSEYRNCQICGSNTSVTVFPACFADVAAIRAEDLRRSEEETSCFHHDGKKAVQSCTRCGKFLCALCAVEVGSDMLCPECLVTAEKNGTDLRFQRKRTLFDSIALTLAVAPVFTISLTLLGAPMAIYVALRYWRRPTSILRRFRWRQYAALFLGLGELAFWAFLFITAIAQRAGR